VNLAGVKALDARTLEHARLIARLRDQVADNTKLRDQVAELKRQNEELTRRLERLEAALGGK